MRHDPTKLNSGLDFHQLNYIGSGGVTSINFMGMTISTFTDVYVLADFELSSGLQQIVLIKVYLSDISGGSNTVYPYIVA